MNMVEGDLIGFAKEVMKMHQKALGGRWEEGAIHSAFCDANGDFCIQYQSGNIYHYEVTPYFEAETDKEFLDLEWW